MISQNGSAELAQEMVDVQDELARVTRRSEWEQRAQQHLLRLNADFRHLIEIQQQIQPVFGQRESQVPAHLLIAVEAHSRDLVGYFSFLPPYGTILLNIVSSCRLFALSCCYNRFTS